MKKLRITDYVIIFFVIVFLGICGFVVFKKKNFSNLPIEKESTIRFEVFFRGITITALEAPFKIGDDAFIIIRNVPYTKLKIVGIDGRPRMKLIPSTKNPKGVIAVEDVAVPFLFDMILVLEDKAKKTPDGYVAGGNKVKMGLPVTIEGEKYRYNGVISNIVEVEEDKNL